MNKRRLIEVIVKVLTVAVIAWWFYDSTVLASEYEERKYQNIGNYSER